MTLLSTNITTAEFEEILTCYPALIRDISDSKARTTKGDSLEDLDEFRFKIAPAKYNRKKDGKDDDAHILPLEKVDVLKLVTWKLKHGTFRPKLMQLAASNSEKDITRTTSEAYQTYRGDHSNAFKAVKLLTSLKGIGPATASLLLSVHAPADVVFFGDEVYQWICCGGQKKSIKYNLKEYQDLLTRSRTLAERLRVDASDVEKVGFVIMRGSSTLTQQHIHSFDPAKENMASDLKMHEMGEGITPSPPLPKKSKRSASRTRPAESASTTSKRLRRDKKS
ncbi:MAG: hypothetical protein M1818_002144 [Claussenomyces sp. TS43310]|nr:MAG: hypothetical protein M1818_002144 [Claussenomyces sp. TS43310]